MPLVNPKPSAPPVAAPIPVQITKPDYKGVTVDTRYQPSKDLIAYMEGSIWTVNYYSQVLDASSPVMGQNQSLDAVFQQYELVKGFELKVVTALSTAQDTTTNQMQITGTSNVYPFLIPNVGDMFLADIGDGKEGLFRITNVDRKSIFKDTVHVVEYVLIGYSNPENVGDLNSKVVKTVQFVKDFLQHGQNPLLVEEDYLLLEKLEDRYLFLTRQYFKAFMSREYTTLLVPGQEHPVYDHFLTAYVKMLFTTYDAPELRYIRLLNVDGDDIMRATNIWDALKNREQRLIKFASKKAGLISARTFTSNPMLESIYHSGITYVVYPKDPELTVDYLLVKREKPMADDQLQNQPSALAGVDVPDLSGLPGGGNIPLTNPVLVDDYYVFSQAFYEGATTGLSYIEICVQNYLEGKAQDNKVLLALCDAYHTWGALERFYYVPVLLTLLKASIRSV